MAAAYTAVGIHGNRIRCWPKCLLLIRFFVWVYDLSGIFARDGEVIAASAEVQGIVGAFGVRIPVSFPMSRMVPVPYAIAAVISSPTDNPVFLFQYESWSPAYRKIHPESFWCALCCPL